jgi:hypothetical protein
VALPEQKIAPQQIAAMTAVRGILIVSSVITNGSPGFLFRRPGWAFYTPDAF